MWVRTLTALVVACVLTTQRNDTDESYIVCTRTVRRVHGELQLSGVTICSILLIATRVNSTTTNDAHAYSRGFDANKGMTMHDAYRLTYRPSILVRRLNRRWIDLRPGEREWVGGWWMVRGPSLLLSPRVTASGRSPSKRGLRLKTEGPRFAGPD